MCGKKGGERVRAAGMDENDFFPGWTLRVEAAAAGVIGGDRICLGVISTSFLTGLWLIPIPTSRCFLSLFSTRRLETWRESLALPIRPHKLLTAGSTAKRSDETRGTTPGHSRSSRTRELLPRAFHCLRSLPSFHDILLRATVVKL